MTALERLSAMVGPEIAARHGRVFFAPFRIAPLGGAFSLGEGVARAAGDEIFATEPALHRRVRESAEKAGVAQHWALGGGIAS